MTYTEPKVGDIIKLKESKEGLLKVSLFKTSFFSVGSSVVDRSTLKLNPNKKILLLDKILVQDMKDTKNDKNLYELKVYSIDKNEILYTSFCEPCNDFEVVVKAAHLSAY